ncbi:NAD(P)-binding protein [Bacillus sp. UNC438CL73TsuS30]|uniref:NAD(P)-binding protein n=1 Tax=Bacillus sp. UNC438CL73TsuS30 TaxID=1340434 RepID=UPI000A66BD7E|nr:NAD(P)-binding protein [Bacillus sp. UNC438CL73TsuS30]
MAHTPLARMMKMAFVTVRAEMEKQSNGQAIRQLHCIPNHGKIQKEQPLNVYKEKHDHPRIVIVGAGLAGLTCAYRLKQAGIPSTIYEATNRVGGRCRTRRLF